MIFNYSEFVREFFSNIKLKDGEYNISTKEGDFTFNINDITKVELYDSSTPDFIEFLMRADNHSDEIFTDAKKLYQKNLRNKYISIYIIKDYTNYILNVTLKTFKDLIDKDEKVRKSSDFEYYQILGLICKYNNSEAIYTNKFKKSDFLSDILIDDEPSLKFLDKKESISEDFNDLIKGSCIFKNNMDSLLFKSNYIIFNKRGLVIKQLIKVEERINKAFGFNLNDHKLNTSDAFIFNKKINIDNVFDNMMILPRTLGKDNICYLIPDSKVLSENLDNIKENFNISEYEDVVNNIIDNYISEVGDGNITKFIQVSFKKSKTGAQFGKSTIAFRKLFGELYFESINEEISFKDIKDFFKNIFNGIKKFFSNLYDKYKSLIGSEANDEHEDVFNLISNATSLVIENSENIDNTGLETIETKIYGKKLFVYVNNVEYKKGINDNIREFKLEASKKIDYLLNKIIDDLLNTISNGDDTRTNSFDKKMTNIISSSIMGATNLPIYLVYEYNKEDKRPYSLHKIKSIKEATHLKNLRAERLDPPYIIEIKNYISNGELIYKTMSLYIFNYMHDGEDKKYYFKVRFGTNSSSRKTFMAESLAPTNKEINRLLEEYKKMI